MASSGRLVLAGLALLTGRALAADEFYTKRMDSGGIPILAHASVSDEGMRAARERLERLLAGAPKLRRNLEGSRFELHVVGLRQFTSDLPEHRSWRGRRLETGELFDRHMIGGHIAGRFGSCTEGTLLPIVGHGLFGDETCLHELAHAVESLAFGRAARIRLAEEFKKSVGAGLWKGLYASKDQSEWFAEATKYYFRADNPDMATYDEELAKGHDWFCRYDKAACRFVEDVYSGRLDPGDPRSTTAPLLPGKDEAKLRSRDGAVSVRLLVRNLSPRRIHTIWIDYEGKRDKRGSLLDVEPGEEAVQSTFATHPFILADDAGTALCVFVVGEDDTVVEFKRACD